MNLLSKLNLVSSDDYDDIEERNKELLKRIGEVRNEKYDTQVELKKEKKLNTEIMKTNDSLGLELFKYKCGLPIALFCGLAIGYFLR